MLIRVDQRFDPSTNPPLWILVPDPEDGTRGPAVAGEWLYVGSGWTGTLFAYR